MATVQDSATAALRDAPASAVLDAAVLDPRTRSHAVRFELARPGPHLALQAGETALVIALKDGVTHIGRGLSADIRIEDQHASRRHAVILHCGDRVLLLDDRSAAGTFVNGRRVAAAELHDDDTIGLGPLVLRFIQVVVAERHPQVAREAARAHGRRSQRALEGWISSGVRARARERAGLAARPAEASSC
jgi:hypothetical protein